MEHSELFSPYKQEPLKAIRAEVKVPMLPELSQEDLQLLNGLMGRQDLVKDYVRLHGAMRNR